MLKPRFKSKEDCEAYLRAWVREGVLELSPSDRKLALANWRKKLKVALGELKQAKASKSKEDAQTRVDFCRFCIQVIEECLLP